MKVTNVPRQRKPSRMRQRELNSLLDELYSYLDKEMSALIRDFTTAIDQRAQDEDINQLKERIIGNCAIVDRIFRVRASRNVSIH